MLAGSPSIRTVSGATKRLKWQSTVCEGVSSCGRAAEFGTAAAQVAQAHAELVDRAIASAP